jgi:hypothetical protein
VEHSKADHSGKSIMSGKKPFVKYLKKQIIRKVKFLVVVFFKSKLINEITEGYLHDIMEFLKLKNS